jgi:hypothetical protein
MDAPSCSSPSTVVIVRCCERGSRSHTYWSQTPAEKWPDLARAYPEFAKIDAMRIERLLRTPGDR